MAAFLINFSNTVDQFSCTPSMLKGILWYESAWAANALSGRVTNGLPGGNRQQSGETTVLYWHKVLRKG